MKAGLSKKTITIDLTDFSDKECIVCFGANGTGKSTFLSFVHPTAWPSNGRRKIVVPGKEGLLIRKYTDNDGTVITTKIVYRPKKDGGHTPSCFFEIEKPGCDPVELNDTGNITSYDILLDEYFGVNKDFITYATYSNEVASIVRMTDGDRKNSIGTLVPNTRRFSHGYMIVSDKYKEMRTTIRNISQKITALRDEDSMESDLKRLTKEMRELTGEREDCIQKAGKLDGRLKEISGGKKVDEMLDEYSQLLARDASQSKELSDIMHRIH
ncbi:MAG: hypothetical protein K2F99_00950, partial [Muribaculaceae bacterium]|nr:hypothetical protein [Muribaculaceae bacterium]